MTLDLKEPLREWLLTPREGDTFTEDELRIREVVAEHAASSVVANRLIDAVLDDDGWPSPEEIVFRFIEYAVILGMAWKVVNSDQFLQRKAWDEQLEAAVRRLDNLLARDSTTIAWYLGTIANHDPSFPIGAKRLNDLRATLADLRRAASNQRSMSPDQLFGGFSRKRGSKNAQLTFFCRELTYRARAEFGSPKHREVGMLAAVVLNLKQVPDSAEVKELVKRSKSNGRKGRIRPAESREPPSK